MYSQDSHSKNDAQFRQLLSGLVTAQAIPEQLSSTLVTPKESKDFVVRLLEADVDDKKLAGVLAALFECDLFGGVIQDPSTLVRSGGDACPWLIADDVLYVTNPYDRGQIEPLMRRKKNEQDSLRFSKLGIIAMRDFDADVVVDAETEGGQRAGASLSSSGIWARDFVDSLLTDAIQRQATDIHISPENHGIVIRYRIDGLCDKVRNTAFQNIPLEQLKLLTNNIMDRVGKQNNYLEPSSGYLGFKLGHKQVAIRMEMAPVKIGTTKMPKLTLRLLNLKRSISRLEHFNLPENQLNCLKSLSSRPHGLIVVTGPTGSGKSTTLKAILREIRDTYPEKTVYTIEDPVEEQLDGVMSLEVDQHISFASALRSLLRHDPDVIMVGEIRDQDTAELAVRAALTGHLVLTTLHSNDAHGAINRLRDFGIENALIADNLLAITAQRLVAKICKSCSELSEPLQLDGLSTFLPGPVESNTGALGHGNPTIRVRQRAQQSGEAKDSCHHCNAGYSGRMMVQEIFENTPMVRDAIARGEGAQFIRQHQINNGQFQDLWQHGVQLLLKGETSINALESKLGTLSMAALARNYGA